MEFIQKLPFLSTHKILLGIISFSIFLATCQLLSLLISMASSGRTLKRGFDRFSGMDYKKYLPFVIGALLGFLVASSVTHALITAVAGGLLGLGGRKLYQWMHNKLTEEKKAGEILILYEIISVYSATGYSLYEALVAGKYLTGLIRKPLERCLNRWSFGPQAALEKLSEEISGPEARALARILQRALVIGPGKLADFLEKESDTMEKLRQYRIEQGLSARPIIQTLYLLFPGLALMGVTLIPIGYYIQKSITAIKLN